jgi:hypothetical protein
MRGKKAAADFERERMRVPMRLDRQTMTPNPNPRRTLSLLTFDMPERGRVRFVLLRWLKIEKLMN